MLPRTKIAIALLIFCVLILINVGTLPKRLLLVSKNHFKESKCLFLWQNVFLLKATPVVADMSRARLVRCGWQRCWWTGLGISIASCTPSANASRERVKMSLVSKAWDKTHVSK